MPTTTPRRLALNLPLLALWIAAVGVAAIGYWLVQRGNAAQAEFYTAGGTDPLELLSGQSTTTMGGLLLAAGVVGLLLALATQARARFAAILAANTATDAATLEPAASEELDDLDDDDLDEVDEIGAETAAAATTDDADSAAPQPTVPAAGSSPPTSPTPRRNPRRTASDPRSVRAQRCLRTSSMNAAGSSTQMRSPVMVCSPPFAGHGRAAARGGAFEDDLDVGLVLHPVDERARGIRLLDSGRFRLVDPLHAGHRGDVVPAERDVDLESLAHADPVRPDRVRPHEVRAEQADIQVTPQMPRMRNAMRTAGQRCTMRSTIGISTAESTMKIRSTVNTGLW